MQLKTKLNFPKASALIVTTLVLGLILSIALSMSMTSIMKRKASESSSESNLAFSRAETGIELTMQKIKVYSEDTIIEAYPDCNLDSTTKTMVSDNGQYKIEFRKSDDTVITDCDTDIADIATIKSTGMTNNNQRAIEVAVAGDVPSGTWCGLAASNSGDYESIWGTGGADWDTDDNIECDGVDISTGACPTGYQFIRFCFTANHSDSSCDGILTCIKE